MNKVYQKGWTVYGYADYPKLYLDWVNNFLTVERFAEYYNMTQEQAEEVIDLGHKTDNFTKYWN